MKVIKGSFADKMGVIYSQNPAILKLKGIGDEWADVIKNPAKYTRGKLF